MSFVRLLSPARGPRSSSPGMSSSSPPRLAPAHVKPTLHLNVPSYGAVFVNNTHPEPHPEDPTQQYRSDSDLRGELEVRMPQGCGRLRCQAIRVGIRTIFTLNLPGRKKQEEVIFERKVEIIGGNHHGVVLEEGMQRFEFTLILPATLTTHNWVTYANISHNLYAELEGQPVPPSPGLFTRPLSLSPFSSGSKTPLSSSSRSRSRSTSPMRDGTDPQQLNAALMTAAASMSITRQEGSYLPQAPSYDQSQAEARGATKRESGDDWLIGTHTVERTIMIIHNPHPAGLVNQLDERVSDFTPGLGVYDLRMVADEWYIAGYPLFRFSLFDPSPNVTVFAFRFSLSQTVKVTPPSETPEQRSKPIVRTENFPFVSRGERPPKEIEKPGIGCPALWRGKEAGGRDEGEWKIETKGQIPKDNVLRPSTLPGIITPIHVTHALITEVFFSVWGESADGKAKEDGPGGLRVMRIVRPVVVPSCGLRSEELELPMYERVSCHIKDGAANSACRLCGKWPHETLCTACPSTVIPHLRHDLDPQLIGNKTGRCPLCEGRSFVPEGKPSWKICACGLAIEGTEERMKAFVLDLERERQERNTGRGRSRDREEKEERGRRQTRG